LLSNKDYIRLSLELNLFFLRIAKEHAIFAAASLPPKYTAIASQYIATKDSLEKLLHAAIPMADGLISPDVLSSGELVTNLTLQAENETQFLTGVPIDNSITEKELSLKPGMIDKGRGMVDKISQLNQEAMALTSTAIAFTEKFYKNILACKAFSFIYPSMLDHVLEESKFYVRMLTKLQNRDGMDSITEIVEQELMWNDIMSEHPKFIRGYLDPTEVQLFETADTFSKEFDALLAKTQALKTRPTLLPEITRQSLNDVTNLRNFKKQGTAGILSCKIKSVIPPLLADHVTREANHYLRLLKEFSTIAYV
jgi:hypothetical protein